MKVERKNGENHPFRDVEYLATDESISLHPFLQNHATRQPVQQNGQGFQPIVWICGIIF